MTFVDYSQFTDNVLLHMSATLRRRDMTVSRDLFTCCYGQHFWVKLEKVGKRVADLPVVSYKTAKYLMFHVKQL